MQATLEQIEVDETGEHHFPGITEPTAQEDLADDAFWNEDCVIKLMKFRIRPLLSSYGKLAFRLLMEVADQHKRYNNDS